MRRLSVVTDRPVVMGDSYRARGSCPRCESGNVIHYLYGRYVPDPERRLPEWVHVSGYLVYPGHDHDRECGRCGHLWYEDRDPADASTRRSGSHGSSSVDAARSA
jgi:hypothetical protein